MADETLGGGLANFGQVIRRGDVVERPAPPHAAALHEYLRALSDKGFDGVPRPLALRTDGREELTFLAGDVAVPPYPEWSRSEEVLASVGRMLRRMHDVAAEVPIPEADWPSEFADPSGGSILCHNDACLENVVFRDGEAVALIDFDFAAPGRPLWDLAHCAVYWVPVLTPELAAGEGQPGLDPVRRLRILADGYGLDAAGRRSLVDLFPLVFDVSRRFIAGRVATGDPVFTRIDAERDPLRWEKMRGWLAATRAEFLEALLAA